MKILFWIRALLGIALLGATASASGAILGFGIASQEANSFDVAGGRWIAQKSDNVCGLSDPRQVSKPGKIDYKKVFAATPSMKKLKKDGIDPRSPEGIRLRTKAQDELKKAAEKVRRAKGKCSVWKKIRHTDGRSVTDLTQAVIAKL